MALGKHKHTELGKFRKERSDTLVGTLAKEYSQLEKFNPRMKLGTLEEKLGAQSLSQVLKSLKEKK